MAKDSLPSVRKGAMKSLMLFLQVMLQELGAWCRTSTARDFKEIASRVESEGMSFLTISLANFGSDFQKSLDQGYVGSDQFSGFRRSGGLPRFLSGFLRLVFDASSGRLLDVPDIDAIFSVRQITLAFSKMSSPSHPCSESRVKKAISRYVECEQELKALTSKPTAQVVGGCSSPVVDVDLTSFARIGRLLWSDLLQKMDESIYYGDIIPSHGPGATADKLKGNLKWCQLEWPLRLEKEFSFCEFLIPNFRYLPDISDRVMFLEPGSERPVRVITVPKTLKTPRIIAIEPTAMMYMQQGIHSMMQRAINNDFVANSLIGYSSQIPNQELAKVGSANGRLATLDLREASDRVSNQHVRILLHDFPNLFRAVDATRSRKADVPGHGVIRLAKFASMGSALCFPMESIVFMTIVFLGIEKALNRPLTKEDVLFFLGKVRVYGDDIIVPVEFVLSVADQLHAFGHKVNSDKSFWTGKFRESCGKDYYDGTDISIVRVRRDIPNQRTDVQEIVSTVAMRNQLYEVGMWATARYLDTVLERFIPFPIVSDTSSVLGRISVFKPSDSRSGFWDKLLHLPLVEGCVVVGEPPRSLIDGYPALLKCLSKEGDSPFEDSRHLERSGRPSVVGIKRRKVSPF